jgi:hypothetical protein
MILLRRARDITISSFLTIYLCSDIGESRKLIESFTNL